MATINWQMDPAHSEVRFKAKHMMVSTVTGEFKNFEAHLTTEDHDMTTAKASFSADVNSVTTRVEQRDNHLKSADFFDAENHPKMSFVSTKITKVGDDEYELQGDMTIRGITKSITLNVENTGVIKDPFGNMRTGFDISGKIKRLDFGLKYNAIMEAGGVVVSNDIKLQIGAEFFYKPE